MQFFTGVMPSIAVLGGLGLPFGVPTRTAGLGIACITVVAIAMVPRGAEGRSWRPIRLTLTHKYGNISL